MEMEVDLKIGENARPKDSSSEIGSAKQQQHDSVEKTLGEDSGNGEEYCVGDFVWSKIKNHHQWWPGQIYDPSDASDLALKTKQKGKFLVAYFGDETFAWCGSSQLKPFVESFQECSKISNSRRFKDAVEEAVEEFGRHIERLLISDFDSREAKNDGIKEGVVVCDVRREVISSLLIGKTEEILRQVKGFAETVSFSCLLDLEVLKRMVSAFYRSKRGYGLIEYHEPQSVPGLEDKNNDDDEGDDDEVEKIDDKIKWKRSGAKRSSKEKEEEEEVLDPEESLQIPLENCSGFPDHRLLHRRKQKSIAEILENESAAKVRFKRVPTDGNVKSSKKNDLEKESTTTPRRRKMSKISSIEDTDRKKVDESSKGKSSSMKRKKRDVDEDRKESAHVEEVEKNKVLDPEIVIDSTPLASLRKRAKVDVSSVGRITENGETATLTSKRERRKSKYLSPEYLSDFSVKRKKKSKDESESVKVSSESQVGEQITDAIDSLVAVEEDKLDIPCEPSLDNGMNHQELSEELSKAVDFLRLGATPKEMRDLIRVTALGTQYPKESSSRDMVTEFMSIYRSFTYHEGVNSKLLVSYNSSEEANETGKSETKEKQRKYNKRKSRHETEENEQTREEENESTKKEVKSKKKVDKEEDEPLKEMNESKQKERRHKKKSESKKQADEEEETLKVKKAFSGAELIITFGRGPRIPKREDLIRTYEKFGALDEDRTYMTYINFTARVGFVNIADGEKAFESSQEKCPFASASTFKFRLKYPKEIRKEKKRMEIEYVKKKLEEMRSLLDECVGGMTKEVKVKLEDEIVNLQEKVRKMRSKS